MFGPKSLQSQKTSIFEFWCINFDSQYCPIDLDHQLFQWLIRAQKVPLLFFGLFVLLPPNISLLSSSSRSPSPASSSSPMSMSPNWKWNQNHLLVQLFKSTPNKISENIEGCLFLLTWQLKWNILLLKLSTTDFYEEKATWNGWSEAIIFESPAVWPDWAIY